jgi:radical SAM protein with 4Fe4S-binding SPASM domain
MDLIARLKLLGHVLRDKGLKSSLNLCLSYFTLVCEPSRVGTTPIYLQVEPTTRCNLRCTMCYGKYGRRVCDDLSLDNFKEIVSQFPHVIKIHLQGIGEPFLNKDVFKMIRYAKSKGIQMDLATNTTLIDKDLAREIIAAGLDYIELSIDSPVAATYEAIRVGAAFENVVRNVKNLVEAKGNLKKPEIKILSVVQDESVGEMPQLVEFAHKLDVKSIMFIHLQPWDKDHVKQRHPDEETFTRRFEGAIPKAQRLAKRYGIYLDLSSPPGEYASRECKRPWLSTSILADGYVVPCCRVISPEEINFGNVFQEDFKDIWNSTKYMAFRKSLKGASRPAACDNCYFYYRNPLSRDHI